MNVTHAALCSSARLFRIVTFLSLNFTNSTWSCFVLAFVRLVLPQLDLVDRSLRESMGGAYGRMLHRAKRTERIKIATQRHKSLPCTNNHHRPGDPHATPDKKKTSHFATLKASLSSSFTPGGAHGQEPALPTLLHPRFLYNARASARTFCGVNLVEDFARYKHKPKAFNAAVSAFSSISSFDMSSLHGGLKFSKSPFKHLNGSAQSTAGCLPSTCFEYPYIVSVSKRENQVLGKEVYFAF